MSGPSQYPYYPLSPLKVDYFSAILGFPLTARGREAVRERLKLYRERGGVGGRMDSWGDEKEGGGGKIKKVGKKPVEGKDGKKEESKGEKKKEEKGGKKGEKKGEWKKEEKKEERSDGEKAAFTEEEDRQILEWNGSGKAWKELAKILQRPESDQFLMKARAKELAAKGGGGAGKEKKEVDGMKGEGGKKQGKGKLVVRFVGTSDVDPGDDWVNVDEGAGEGEGPDKKGNGGRENTTGGKVDENRKTNGKARKRDEGKEKKKDSDKDINGAGNETATAVFEEGDLILLRRLLDDDSKVKHEKTDRLSRAIRVKSRFFDLVSRDVHEEDVADTLQLR